MKLAAFGDIPAFLWIDSRFIEQVLFLRGVSSRQRSVFPLLSKT